MNNNDLLKSLNAKQKQNTKVVVSQTTTSTSEVIKLKPTKWDYIITMLLILMIIVAVGFIVWTRHGYADNFTEQFDKN